MRLRIDPMVREWATVRVTANDMAMMLATYLARRFCSPVTGSRTCRVSNVRKAGDGFQFDVQFSDGTGAFLKTEAPE